MAAASDRARTRIAAHPAGAAAVGGTVLRGEAAMGFLFIAPLLMVFVVFVLYPVMTAVGYSLSRYQFLTGNPPAFDGLANFQRWASDPRLLGTIGTTLGY